MSPDGDIIKYVEQCIVYICSLAKSCNVFAEPLKRQTKIAADDLLIFYFYLPKKIRLDVSSEFSAKQRIHLKHQVLFSLKNNEKMFINVVCCSRDWRCKGKVLLKFSPGTTCSASCMINSEDVITGQEDSHKQYRFN